MNRSSAQRVALVVACGAAGFLLNRWRIGSAAPLLLGRVITLPIAILFGPWLGAAAAAIAALPASGPASAALVLLPVEAFVVGWFARRGRSPLVGGLIMWAAIAATLVAVPSLYGLGYLRQTILPVALQIIISGLVGVVLADLIATGASAKQLVSRDHAPTTRHLRSYAFHAFVLVATLPVLLLSAVDGQLTAVRQETDGAARLREAVAALTGHIDEHVTEHEHAVRTLAAALREPKLTSADRQRLIDLYHEIYPGFITLFTADRAGIVHEIYPTRDDPAPPVSDREYFIEAMRSRKPAVSEVILGRLSHVPIVTIAVPILSDGGDATGVAGGSLDLSQFQRFVDDFKTLRDVRVTLLDQHDRLIYANGQASFTALQNLAEAYLVVASAAARDGIYRYQDSSGRGPQLAAAATIPHLGWKLFIAQPLLMLRLQPTGYYVLTIVLMLLALGGAVLGARGFAGAVTRPLEEVVTIVRNISAHGGQAEARLSSNPPAEIAALLDDVNGMQSRLGDSYQQLEQALIQRERLNTELRALTEDLDRKVRERTA